MKRFRYAFRNVKRRFDAKAAHGEPGLVCKLGSYGGSVVLKLQKPSWTNDSMRRVPDDTGIFFSVWLDEDDAEKGRANYNIHALKLRKLEGYRLTSNDFADDFRRAFERVRRSWPNASIDYGPQTLMQGWIEIDARRFERDVLDLMHRFDGELSPIIDDLLARREVPSPKRPRR
jgi:hypothetical protein